MAFGASTISDIAGGVGDIFGGIATGEADALKAEGLRTEAADYGLAAELAGENEQYTVESTAVQQAALQRNFEKAQGTTGAEVAGAGFENKGSAEDIMRSNAQQGTIAQQVAGQQGLITEAGYAEQQTAYLNMQAAANSAADEEGNMGNEAGVFGAITGGLKLAAGFATLF